MSAAITPQPDAAVFARAFEELKLGQRFATRSRTVTEADVNSLAMLSGEPRAEAPGAPSPTKRTLAGRSAHGLLLLSYAIGLVPLNPVRIVALRRVRNPLLQEPVRVGDTLHVEGAIERLEPIDARVGAVLCPCRILSEQRRTVGRGTIELLWRRGASRAREPSADPAWDDDPILP
jgi:3-hydroxybutyryl-CoA dehydratase